MVHARSETPLKNLAGAYAPIMTDDAGASALQPEFTRVAPKVTQEGGGCMEALAAELVCPLFGYYHKWTPNSMSRLKSLGSSVILAAATMLAAASHRFCRSRRRRDDQADPLPCCTAHDRDQYAKAAG